MKRLPLIGIVFFFFTTLLPYHLYGSSQLFYFLQHFHQLDPNFLNRDWFVAQTANLNPFFAFSIALLHHLGNFPLSLFIIHKIQFLFLILGIFQLTRLFSKDPRTAFLVFSLLLFYFGEGLGQTTLYSSLVQANDLSMLFYLFSLIALFQEKIFISWVFLGFCGLLHAQLGVEGALLFFIFWVCRGRGWSLGQMSLGFGVFLILFAPNLVPLIRDYSPSDLVNSPELSKVLFNFRGPHHYRPSVFELSHSFRVLFPLTFVFFQGKLSPEEKNVFGHARLFIGILLFFCFLAALSIEWFYFPFIVSLRFFRLSPFLLLVGLIFLASRLVEEADKKNTTGIFLTMVTLGILFLEKDSRLFVPLSLFLVLAWSIKNKIESQAGRIQKILFGIICLAIPAFLYLAVDRVQELIFNAFLGSVVFLFLTIPWHHAVTQAVLGTFLLGIPALAFHFIHPERIAFHPPQVAPSPLLYQEEPALETALEWIRNHTEKDALLFTPPYQDGIRFFAERAIIVDFHAGPYRTRDLAEWKKRLETLTQTFGLEKWIPTKDDTHPQREFLRRGYLNLKAEEVEKIARLYQADYFMTESIYADKDALARKGHPLVFENSSYLIFRLKGS